MPYRMLACDYDNTLVPYGAAGPSKALCAEVRRIRADGVKFALCTGRCRAAFFLEPSLLKGLSYDYLVCSNGAQVFDAAGKELYAAPLTNEEMYALVDFCEDYEHPIDFAFSDGYYAYVGYEEIAQYYAVRGQKGIAVHDGEDQDRHLTEMPTAAFADFPAGELERFQEKYGYLGLVFQPMADNPAGHCFYDVMHAGVDKGTGLAGLCQTEGIALCEVVAAGDAANDIGMIRAVGLGCAMENATPAAKAAAARVIGHVKQDGVAALAAELWPEKAAGL